jgi:hypothetical protein
VCSVHFSSNRYSSPRVPGTRECRLLARVCVPTKAVDSRLDKERVTDRRFSAVPNIDWNTTTR